MAQSLTCSTRLRRITLLVICVFTLTLSSNAVAIYDIALLSQAAGQYIGAHQWMWYLKNSECGYLVEGNYGLQAGFDIVEKHFRPDERMALREYLASSEWQLKDQDTYFLVMTAINAPEFKHLTKTERCNKAYTLGKGLFLQSRQRWEHAVRYFSR